MKKNHDEWPNQNGASRSSMKATITVGRIRPQLPYFKHSITTRLRKAFASIVGTNQLGLILLSTRLCLAEGKAAITTHPLNSTNLLDCFLKLFLPGSVIRNVVLLQFLSRMVRQRLIRSSIVFPGVISRETKYWHQK